MGSLLVSDELQKSELRNLPPKKNLKSSFPLRFPPSLKSFGRAGKVSGMSTALGSLMSIFGPLFAGATYDHVAPAAPFWIGAALFMLAGLFLIRVKIKIPESGQVGIHSTAE